MAEGFLEGISVHRIVLHAGHGRIILLIKSRRSRRQHAAVVFPDGFFQEVRISGLAVYLIFVKFKVRRGDLRHFVIEDHPLVNVFFHGVIAAQEKVSQNVALSGHVSFTRLVTVDKYLFLCIVEFLKDLLPEFFCLPAQTSVISSDHRTDGRITLHGFGKKDLFSTERSCLVHGSPVDKHPVTGLSSHETVLIPSFQTEIHNRLHLVLDLLQEILIPVGLIILVKTDDPEKTVIHDRVDMYLEGLFSAQSDQRPLLDLFIKKEIAVHEKALVGIC